MARRKSPSKSTGLGMGLDALIKSKTREEPREETVEAEAVKDEKDTIKKNSEVIDDLDESNSKAELAKNSVKKKKSNSEKSSKPSVSSSKSVKKTDESTSESKADLSTKNTAKINESDNKSVISADVERINVVVGDVKKNPRITLWSSRSAAVLRYLKKTQPEFSISKEASKLIEDAVKEKYPEIWDLFDDL